ncbi:MAG: DUF4386 family protein [Anaerolineales bacterium]|nr:MAG: DUF4386 family protein [Anaerolineales bacterium]
MNTLQKSGGIAALYMAAAHSIGIVIFIVILDVLSISDPAQKLAMNIEKQTVIFSTNLLMYVFFGFALIVLSLALYDRLKSGAPVLMQVATAIGIIWAGSLIASGMAANAGLATIVALYAKDPTQAALTFQAIESITNGLGNANGEILGGPLTLLVSLAAMRTGGLPKGLNILGVLVGAVGIITIIPALNALVAVFGLGQIIWFVWLGIAMLRSNRSTVAQKTDAFMSRHSTTNI